MLTNYQYGMRCIGRTCGIIINSLRVIPERRRLSIHRCRYGTFSCNNVSQLWLVSGSNPPVASCGSNASRSIICAWKSIFMRKCLSIWVGWVTLNGIRLSIDIGRCWRSTFASIIAKDRMIIAINQLLFGKWDWLAAFETPVSFQCSDRTKGPAIVACN